MLSCTFSIDCVGEVKPVVSSCLCLQGLDNADILTKNYLHLHKEWSTLKKLIAHQSVNIHNINGGLLFTVNFTLHIHFLMDNM